MPEPPVGAPFNVTSAVHESLQATTRVEDVVKFKPTQDAAFKDVQYPQHRITMQRQYLARYLRKTIRLLSVQFTKTIKETQATKVHVIKVFNIFFGIYNNFYFCQHEQDSPNSLTTLWNPR